MSYVIDLIYIFSNQVISVILKKHHLRTLFIYKLIPTMEKSLVINSYCDLAVSQYLIDPIYIFSNQLISVILKNAF